MIHTFETDPYHLIVEKVEDSGLPRYGRVDRDIKVVFEAYKRDPDGSWIRCAERRIAQHVILTGDGRGKWRTDRTDGPFLEALGLDRDPSRWGNFQASLRGREIEGVPGPAGPEGYNALMRVGPATPGPRPAPPTSEAAHEGAVIAGVARANLSPRRRTTAPTADRTEARAELEEIVEHVVRKLSEAGMVAGSDVSGPSPHVPPAAKKAYWSYKVAEQSIGAELKDREAWEWLREHGLEEYKPPDYNNWARYLRQARSILGDAKHHRRDTRSGGSIAHPSEI